VCDVFWGSHGCSLEDGHVEHICEGCCDPSHQHQDAPNGYGFNGCAGAWPYYGRDKMSGESAALPFFLYYKNEKGEWVHENLPDEFHKIERYRLDRGLRV
jgi:hypothetical protein